MTPIFVILVTGFTATTAMIALMYAMVWRGFRHGDMISTLGARFSRSPRSHYAVGLAIYYLVGLLLSLPYNALLPHLLFEGILPNAGYGIIMGTFQGFIVTSLFVEDLVDPSKPRLKRGSFLPVTFTHWFGHICFGFAQGVLIGSYMTQGERGLLIASVLFLCAAAVIFTLNRHKKVAR